VGNYLSFDVMGGLSALAAPGRYDVVMASSPPLTLGLTGYLARLFKGRSFVYNIQDLWPGSLLASGFLKPGLVSRALGLLERFVYARASRLTVLADEVRDGLIARGVPQDKIGVIPNFADTEAIVPLPRRNGFRDRIGLGDEFVVMYAGALAYRFGLDTLLKAAARMDHDDGVRFVVVGNGPLEGSLRGQAAAMSLRNVLFAPFQPAAELPQVLAAADVSVIPFRKGAASASVPSKMYGIMASGRPVLAMAEPETGTAGTIRRAGCGVCVEPENVDALVSAIAELRADPARRQEMGRSGRQCVLREHSLSAIADKYEALFLGLAGRTS
jgi:colanic acid biosynthesis glycosyl transferase WcaI